MAFPSFHDRIGREIEFLCPTALSQAFTVPFDPNIGSSIRRLLFEAGPTAIIRHVVAIIVDAIKRVPVWASAHIGEEACEVMPPERADLYSAPSVVRELFAISIFATVYHLRPRNILTALSPAMGLSQLTIYISQKASTRPCVFVPQRMARNNLLLSALAAAKPETKRWCGWRLFSSTENSESAEYFSGQFKWAHQWILRYSA